MERGEVAADKETHKRQKVTEAATTLPGAELTGSTCNAKPLREDHYREATQKKGQ